MLKIKPCLWVGSPIHETVKRSICSLRRQCSSSSQPPKKTALYDFHVAQQGKMVPFAGYLMPVHYTPLSITQSHLHTRLHSSIFDVSHMLQSEVHGKDRIEFMESLVTGDIGTLPAGQGSLTLFTKKENGGIIDDLIVSNAKEGHLYVVSNAGCRDKDIPLMQAAEKEFQGRGKDVKLVLRDDLSLIAVQGPSAAKALQPLVSIDLSKLYFMNTSIGEVAGVAGCRITRCGYTGEDGVEISVPSEKIVHVVNALLASKVGNVQLAGLGARDSLRLEAGLCLYGNDMDESTTPVEAALTWLIGKQRRARQDFPGASIIMEQVKDGSKVGRRRVGLRTPDGPPPRSHMEIQSLAGEKIGEVTSGCPGPSMAPLNIAMGYVTGDYFKPGTKVNVKVRNKLVAVEVVKIPFLKGKYFVPPKK